MQSAVNEAHAIVKYQLAGQEENVKRLKTAFSAVLALSTVLIRMRFIRNGYVEGQILQSLRLNEIILNLCLEP